MLRSIRHRADSASRRRNRAAPSQRTHAHKAEECVICFSRCVRTLDDARNNYTMMGSSAGASRLVVFSLVVPVITASSRSSVSRAFSLYTLASLYSSSSNHHHANIRRRRAGLSPRSPACLIEASGAGARVTTVSAAGADRGRGVRRDLKRRRAEPWEPPPPRHSAALNESARRRTCHPRTPERPD